MTGIGLLSGDAGPLTCAKCGTQVPPSALACPACLALVHSAQLTDLAQRASAASAAGDNQTARARWTEALALVPPASKQHSLISARIAAVPLPLSDERPAQATHGNARVWRRGGIGVAVSIALFSVGKLKFLLLGLTKASTFVSMFGFFAVYWSIYGWPLALGLVGTIYIHEMGHVAMLRRLGIQSGAPLFIPGMGALVMLKQHITDPIVDARIGLAGPVWGLGAAVGAGLMYLVTGADIWRAIAELTGFLNLFNLIPVWQLDGSRGFHALNRDERWLVVCAVAVTLLVTGQRMLFLIGGVAAYRAFRTTPGPGDRRTLATFVTLVAALAWIARAVR